MLTPTQLKASYCSYSATPVQLASSHVTLAWP